MKYLAIETSSIACSVALAIDDEIFDLHEIAPQLQSQMLLPMIERLLKSKNLMINQLDALAFGSGPGSFTGVRIATSVTQGLAFAMNLPVIPISSLAALAQTAHEQYGYQKLLVAIDARMQETYWAAYEANALGLVSLCGNEHISKPEDMILPDQSWAGVGNAWDIYKDRIVTQPIQTDSVSYPTAKAVAQLAKEKFLRQDWVDAAEVSPSYLRDSVAKKMNKS
jgi:tRNA threonylcarbamoyladenosine biosynthesis protein TsaB